MWQEIRFAFRTLGRTPGFTTVAIVVLALGIGVNATVFSMVNAILFKNLPFADSDRVLYLTSFNLKNPAWSYGVSFPDYQDLSSSVKSFEGLGASSRSRANLSDDIGVPESYGGAQITANSFSLIGQRPILGRDFLPQDQEPDQEPVALLSYGLWETRYGKDPSIVGQKVRIDSIPVTVIGVMPRGLVFPPETDFWQPLVRSATDLRQDRFLSVFGKLARGTSRDSAMSELATLSQGLGAQYPDSNKDIGYRIQSFTEQAIKGKIRTVFLVLLGAVGFVLLIACANVANLMLARAVGRSRETSIRVALGAGRWRIIRQLLIESLMLSIAGGAIAWLIAKWGIRAFDAALIPTGKPAWIDFSMDYRAFGYLAGISISAAILFGLTPALRLCRVDVNTALKDGGRGAGAAVSSKHLSGVLVTIEMTLAVVLLTGAGLMIRSFLWAYSRPTGADTANILTMRLDLPEAKYRAPEQQIAFERTLADRLRSLPGVETAAANVRASIAYEPEGPPIPPADRPAAMAVIVGEGYFEILRVLPLSGRDFTAADNASGLPAAVINRSFAARCWPGQDPVGKRLRVFTGNTVGDWMTVVGVVPDILPNPQSNDPEPTIYMPFRLAPRMSMSVIARTRVEPSSVGQAVRKEVEAIDRDLPLHDVQTLDDKLKLGTWPLRVFGSVFAIFAGIALLLATVGLYAVVAYGVNQRTNEIGVRIALGASAAVILRMVFTGGMTQMAIGLGLGLAGAFGLTRVLAGILVGVSATDPLTFGAVALVLIAAAGLGCAIPASRAIRVDPVTALRHE